jgi:hypothetical protein
MSDFTTLQSLLNSANVQTSIELPKQVKRFLLVSTHAQQTTGYSKVSHNLIQSLSKNPNIMVFHFGFQRFFEIGENYRPYPTNVDVYDPAKHEREDSRIPKEKY